MRLRGGTKPRLTLRSGRNKLFEVAVGYEPKERPMKKLLIALATAGLCGGAGIVLACDEYQKDASTDASQTMSVGSAAMTACKDDCNAKPEPAAVKSKKATAKTAKKTAVKPEPMALAAQRN